MKDEDILVSRQEHVATVTLNRPEKLNALGTAHLVRFGGICRELAEDKAVRAVVITGAGRGFSSGADISGGGPGAAAGTGKPVRVAGTRLDFITPLMSLMKPTIAAVNGIAVGAGLGIALACDMRVAGESAAFLANFRQLGLAATDGVTYLLPRIVGTAKALELLYSGERVDAPEAARLGLVSRVVPDRELMDRVQSMAQHFAEGPPAALQLTKAMVMNSLDRPYADSLLAQEYGYLANTVYGREDTAEAAKARQQNRPPAFGGDLPTLTEYLGGEKDSD